MQSPEYEYDCESNMNISKFEKNLETIVDKKQKNILQEYKIEIIIVKNNNEQDNSIKYCDRIRRNAYLDKSK
jgi:hypothetical protein